MLEKFSYINSRNQKLDFGDGAGLFANYSDIHDHQWSYTKTGTRVSSFDRAISSKKINGFIKAPSEAKGIEYKNKLCDIADVDVLNKQPGKLIVGDWYLPCYITGVSYGNYLIDKSYLSVTLTLLVENPTWIKEREYNFGSGFSSMIGGYDYAHDYPVDYGTLPVDKVENESIVPCDFIMRVYGSAVNPAITIGGHIYRVNASVGPSEYLEINSKAKTIVRYTSIGTEVNEFSNRDRNSYIFEKIASGSNAVSYAGSYSVSITLLSERSEPVWT